MVLQKVGDLDPFLEWDESLARKLTDFGIPFASDLLTSPYNTIFIKIRHFYLYCRSAISRFLALFFTLYREERKKIFRVSLGIIFSP